MRSEVKQRRSDPGRRIRDETRPGNRRLQRMQREYQQNYLADPYAGTPVAEIRDFSQHYGEHSSRLADSHDFSAALRTESARFEAPPISLPPQERRKKPQRRMRTELSQQDTNAPQGGDTQRDSALQTERREVLHSESRDTLQPEGQELSHDNAPESRFILEPEQRHSRLRFEDGSLESDSSQESCKDAQKKRQRKQSARYVQQDAGKPNGENSQVLATGKDPASRSRLRFTAEELTAPISAGADAAVSTAGRTLQHKLAEGQDENAAVEAARRSIEVGQAAAHSLHGLKLSGKGSEVTSQHSSRLRFSRSAPASKAEEKAAQKAFFKRKLQKQRTRDEYKASLSGVEKVAGTVKGFASRVLEVITEKKRSIGILVGVLIIALMLSSLLGACGSMLTTAVDAFLQTTWLSEDVDINEADLYYTKLEAELQRKVHRIASEHPGYDEYRYDLDEVGHDPVGLISYLSAEAENGIFVYDSALKDKLEEVFEQQYTLDIQTKLESTTTTRTVRVGESIGRVVTSAYCNCSICCGRWAGGPTASGVYPTSNHTLAVDMYDPIVPMGTKIIMNGRLYKVEDTGYLNRYGVNFDIYMDSHSVAQNWGHKSFEAYLYDANGSSEAPIVVLLSNKSTNLLKNSCFNNAVMLYYCISVLSRNNRNGGLKMEQLSKRLMALILALTMCLSLFCVSVWAGEDPAEASSPEDRTAAAQSIEVDSCLEDSAEASMEDSSMDEQTISDTSADAQQEADLTESEKILTPGDEENEQSEAAEEESKNVVTVQEEESKPVSIELSYSEVHMWSNHQFKLDATVEGSDEPVVWSSSNELIAVVSQDGTITANNSGHYGKCEISAQVGENKAKCTIIVFSPQNTCGNNVYWYFDSSNGRLVLSGSGATYDYSFASSVPWNKDKAKIKKAYVSESITELGKRIFAETPNLKEVILPSTLTLIDQYAFSKCKKLDNLFTRKGMKAKYYPKNSFEECYPRVFRGYTPTAIPKYASMVGTWDNVNTSSAKLMLNDCGKNAYWEYVPSSRTLSISGKGAMYNFGYGQHDCPWDSFAEEINKINIKNGITTIGELAFCGTMQGKNAGITIPNTVKSIGTAAFEEIGPVTINIPGSVKILGEYLFTLSDVKKVKLNEGLEVIKEGALTDANIGKNVTIPSTVKSIGDIALGSNIKTLTFKGNAPKLSKHAFSWSDDDDLLPMKITVYYPKGNKTWKSVIKKQYGGKVKWKAK